MNALRLLLLRDLIIAAALSVPMALHDLFHFSDWLVWGLGRDELRAVRLGLYPMFEHDLLGYISHAGVLLLAWATILFLAWRLAYYIRLLDRTLQRLLDWDLEW